MSVAMSLEMFKSIVTATLLLLAVLQALKMAQVRGYVQLVPWDAKKLVFLHRLGGVAALTLTLIVAGLCLYAVLGQGYSLGAPRLQAHALLGALAALVLLVKVLITNFYRRYLRYNAALGAVAGLLLLGVFVFGALAYFTRI